MFIMNQLQQSATKVSCAPTGNPHIIPMKMRPTLELDFSTALCSTAVSLETPVQNIPPSPTVDTAPAFLTPSNAARALHAVSWTPAELTATGGVCSITKQRQHVSSELAPPPPTSSCREQPVQDLPWRRNTMNAVDNVETSPPVLVLDHASSVLWRTLTPLVKMSVEQTVGIVEDPY